MDANLHDRPCSATDVDEDGTEHCCMCWENPHVRPGVHLCMCGHEWPLVEQIADLPDDRKTA